MDKEQIQSISNRCKWRGKFNDLFGWEYGYLTGIYGNDAWIDNSIVDFNTLGQYIGYTDKNGKEIYEDDIVRLKNNSSFVVRVVYKNGRFVFVDNNTTYELACFLNSEIEVIGNIHDNPELLEKAERGDLIK